MHDSRRYAYFLRRLARGAVLLTEQVMLPGTYDGQEPPGPDWMTTVWVERACEWRLPFEQEVPITRGDGTSALPS
jgi:hypothetical protein